MNDLDIGINVSDIKKAPSNVYPAQTARMIVEAMNIEMNKDDSIKNLNVRLAFVGGALDGRKMFVTHPIASTREKMRDMVASSLERVKDLGMACGVSSSDLAPCIGKEIDVTIGIDKAKGDYPEKNKVTKYAAAKAPSAKATTAPAFMAKKKAAPAAPAVAAPVVEESAPAAAAEEEDGLPF